MYSKDELNSLYNKVTDYCAYKGWQYTKLKTKNNVSSFTIEVPLGSKDAAQALAELAALYHLAPDVYFKLHNLALRSNKPEAKLTGYILYARGQKKQTSQTVQPQTINATQDAAQIQTEKQEKNLTKELQKTQKKIQKIKKIMDVLKK